MGALTGPTYPAGWPGPGPSGGWFAGGGGGAYMQPSPGDHRCGIGGVGGAAGSAGNSLPWAGAGSAAPAAVRDGGPSINLAGQAGSGSGGGGSNGEGSTGGSGVCMIRYQIGKVGNPDYSRIKLELTTGIKFK